MDRAIDQLERLVLSKDCAVRSTGTDAQSPSTGPNSLHRVLLGLSTPATPPTPSMFTPIAFFDPHLNPSQVTAVKFALHAPEVACIHGPPGTGKTRVLVEIIRQMVFASDQKSAVDLQGGEGALRKPLKILVCGASNLAVDNLLERLSAPTPAPSPIQVEDMSSDAVRRALPATPHQFPPIALTRIGHPARVLPSLHSRTLE